MLDNIHKCNKCRFRSDVDNCCKSMTSEYYNINVDIIETVIYEDCTAFYSNIDSENDFVLNDYGDIFS